MPACDSRLTRDMLCKAKYFYKESRCVVAYLLYVNYIWQCYVGRLKDYELENSLNRS